VRIIITVVVALAIGFMAGSLQDTIASPPPQKNSTEARLQALERLFWTEQHAISAVSYKVWERASSCVNADDYTCYYGDTVLQPFTKATSNGQSVIPQWRRLIALSASSNGTWYAQDNQDGG
jgi:hypothetical protein